MPQRYRALLPLLGLLTCTALLRVALANTSDLLYLPLVAIVGTAQTVAPPVTSPIAAETPTTTALATSTVTATATATVTATATGTATATATTTPAGPCAAIYPIGIDAATVTGDTFNRIGVDPLDPNEYKALPNGVIQRRLYIRDNAYPGSFIYLRWHESVAPGGISATSGQALADSLSGEGNYGLGFEEAPWPAGEAAPASYPEQPGLLNMGDWVWGTAGWKENNGVTGVPTALDAQIRLGRPMILPIYSQYRGVGSNVQVYSLRLGLFIATGAGKLPAKGSYLDFVFLGDPPGDINMCPGAMP